MVYSIHGDKFYADGRPKVTGKTKAQLKKESIERKKVSPKFTYKIDLSPKSIPGYNWAQSVHESNKRIERNKGKREDYR